MASHGPQGPGRVPALALVVLVALAISSTDGAAPGPSSAAPDAPRHHSCSLLVVGLGNSSAELADLRLECSPPLLLPGDGTTAAPPPPTVAVNESVVPRRFVDGFKGVKVVGELDCRRAIANPNDGNAPRFPLLFFCGDYGVRFDRPVIRDVWLPTPMDPVDPGVPRNTRTGVLLFGGGVRAVLSGADISDNAVSAVVAAIGPGSWVRIEASTVARNHGWAGTGVVALNGSHVEISGGSAFVDNTAGGSGAAVSAQGQGTTLAISGGSIFASNTAKMIGGAVVVTGGAKASIANGSFTGNRALNASGGAVACWNQGTTLAISGGSVFVNNSATGSNGGAVIVADGSSAMIANANFTGNVVRPSETPGALNGSGGAVAADGIGTKLAITAGSTFTSNMANDGGALAAGNAAFTSIDNSTFTSNEAWNGSGGAMVVMHKKTTLAISGGSVFEDNTARWDGGALLFFAGPSASIADSSFTGNLALDGSGGAVAAVDPGTSLCINSSSAFLNNAARRAGGAVFVSNGTSASVDNSSFTFNKAGWTGGGVAAWGNETSLVISGSSSFANNTVGGWKAGAVATYDRVTVTVSKSCSFDFKEGDGEFTCPVGEERVDGLGPRDVGPHCQPCAPFQYSLEEGGKCKACNASEAFCPGGAVIVAQDSFWQGNGTEDCRHCPLDNIIRCPNPNACNHNAEEVAKQHKYRDSYGPLGMLSPADYNASKYSEQLCNATPPAYTGVLCGACRKPLYGQTAPFTCNACLGVNTTSGQGINRSGIFALYFFYAVCFVAFVLLTTWATLMGNAASRDSVNSHLRGSKGDDAVARAAGVGASCSSVGSTVDSEMHAMHVIKALVMYVQYARIIIHLPINFLPEPLGKAAGSISTMRDSWFNAQSLSWLLGWPASLDCLFAAANLTDRLGVHRAGVKNLINLLAPWALYAAAMWFYAVWWWGLRRPVGTWLRKAAATATLPGEAREWIRRASERLGKQVSLQDYLRQRAVVTALVTVFWWYPTIAGVAMGSFACVDVCPSAHDKIHCKFWVMDMTQACPYTGTNEIKPSPAALRWAVGVGVPAWLVCVAVPVMIVVLLSRAAKEGRLQDSKFVQEFGFLYLDYRFGGCERPAPRSLWRPRGRQAPHTAKAATDGLPTAVVVPRAAPAAAATGTAATGTAAMALAQAPPPVAPPSDVPVGPAAVPQAPPTAVLTAAAPRAPLPGAAALQAPAGAAPITEASAASQDGIDATAVSDGSWEDLGTWVMRRLALVWNAVIHFQTLLLVALAVYGSLMHEYYKAVYMAAMLGCYLLLVVWLRPFRSLAIQRLQALLLAVLCSTLVCILVLMRPEGLDTRQMGGVEKAEESFRCVIIVINAAFVLFAVVLLIVCLVRKVRALWKEQAWRLQVFQLQLPQQTPWQRAIICTREMKGKPGT